MISAVLTHYGIREFTAEPLVSGLINSTWKVTSGADQYILQRINHHVFKHPFDLADNIRRIDTYLKKNKPGYLFPAPLANDLNQDLVLVKDDGYYRLFSFIKGSHTVDVVTSPDQAFEASLQFGKFTSLLSGFDAGTLHTTIQDFHNLQLRYQQFETAIETGNSQRIAHAADLITNIKKHTHVLNEFLDIQRNSAVRKRVTHHDTKISNVLFNDEGKGICVIDLDTVMPGYFISDVGDMMRTYLSPASEEEKDFTSIEIRDDFFRAIVHGYVSAMRDELTTDEHHLIYYAGTFLIYMQAIRFLADYCNDDVYYGAKYPEHNFVRAGNQLKLLQKFEEKEILLQNIIADELRSKKFYPM